MYPMRIQQLGACPCENKEIMREQLAGVLHLHIVR